MKKYFLVSLSLMMGFFMLTAAFAADVDKNAIQNNVDQIAEALNGGEKAEDHKDAANKSPYVFIMEKDGKMLVHPALEGENLKEKAEPVYNALMKATEEGTWVDYEWQGKQKHSYVKKTNDDLIVGSGYSE